MQIKKAKLLCLFLFLTVAVFSLLSPRNLKTVAAFSSGPPAGFTGAPGEQNCTECHIGTVNSGPGQFTISGLPSRYDPGTTYQVVVQHTTTDNSRRRWGFQLTVLDAGNNKAGNLQSNTSLTSIINNDGPGGNRQYIEHNLTGTFAGQTGSASWTFNWTAPATAAGPVTFYAAGNQANNDGNLTGDQIYTTSLTVNPPLAGSAGTPHITGAAINGKKLIITGENFEDGASLFLDDSKVKKTANDGSNPTTTLIAKKGGNLIESGQTVMLQVRNPSGTSSDLFSFTRP